MPPSTALPLSGTPTADLLIRAGRIYTMSAAEPIQRAVAVRDGSIVGMSSAPDGLDGFVSSATHVIDEPQLTVLPAFNDTHNHLLEATRNATFVPVNRAHTIAEFVGLIRDQATRTPPGRWIQTSNAWNEQQLAERRLPTARDLDDATRDHPVIARRGGHMAVLNTRGLQESGITPTTPDPPGGHLGHTSDGALDGILEGGAQYALVRVPQPPIAEQIAGLETTCRAFAAAGIGLVRDPVVSPDGMRLYRAAADQGRLSIRVRPLLLVSPVRSVAERIAQIDGFATRSGVGDDWIKMWGLKFVFDGGPEGGALDQPYANDPSFTGHLNWDPEEMFAVMNAGVQRGWRVATHAIGDRAVRTLLDIYERIASANPSLPPRTLVVEHAFLADREQRQRAIALGVHITVQPALLHALGASLVKLWGPDRTRHVMPVRAWLDEGAELSAGTDYPIGFYEPLRTVWGLATRKTAAVGPQGVEYAVDRATALQLCITGAAALLNEPGQLGPLAVGRFADLAAYRTDPTACPIDELWDTKPAFTLVSGRAAFDPERFVKFANS
jgi:predicted amidohydrolase YtcJ